MKNDIEISNDELVDSTNHVDVEGPSRMLREAREAKGLTQKQVAEKLNFRTSLVADIEKGQFDLSLPVAFNRGYLKNYAKLVNLSPEKVLASYEQLSIAQAKCSDMQSFSKITEKQAENNMLMWITFLIVIMLTTATVVWWYQAPSMQPTPAVIQEVNDNSDGKAERAPTNTPNIENEADTRDSSNLLESLSQDPAATLIEHESTNIEQVEIPNVDEQLLLNNAADETTEHERKVNTEQTIIDSEYSLNLDTTANELSEDPTANNINSTGDVQSAIELQPANNTDVSSKNLDQDTSLLAVVDVIFTFSGDCWVNITDGTGERVAWGMKKSGYVMRISGQAPFNITLGRPELVQIEYDDTAVDMSKFNAGNIAKFSLPLMP